MNKKAAGILGVFALLIAVFGIWLYVQYVGISLPDFIKSSGQSSTASAKKTTIKKPETAQDAVNKNQKSLPKNFLRVVELKGAYDTSKPVNVTAQVQGMTQGRDAVVFKVLSFESKDSLSRALSKKITGLSVLAASMQQSEYKKGQKIHLKLMVYSRPQNLYGFRVAEE